MKKILILATLAIIASCASQKNSKKENCPQTGVSFIEWPITGFVQIKIGVPFPEMNPYQIQIGDTTGPAKNYVLSSHLAVVFSKEKKNIHGLGRTVPAATLCCRWDEEKSYFLADGDMQSVLWAYGSQASIPTRYVQHLKDKKAGKDSREFAYAIYQYHAVWPVSLAMGNQKLDCFQMLLQQKDDNGNITSKLVFVVGMEDSEIKNLVSNNENGLTFELSNVAYDKRSGKWKPQAEVKSKDKVIYTFAWNAKKAGKALQK